MEESEVSLCAESGGGWTLQAETEHMPRQIEVLTSSPGTNTRKSDGGGGTFFHAGSEHI